MRAAHVCRGPLGAWRVAVREPIQDAALTFGARRLTLAAQRLELQFQLLQLGNARRDVRDVLIQQRVGGRAAVARQVIPELQQLADLIERHVQRAAVADEGQPLDVRARVQAIVAAGPVRGRQQPLALVEADGFRLALGTPGKLADPQSRLPWDLTLK